MKLIAIFPKRRTTTKKNIKKLREVYVEHPDYPGFKAMIDSLSFFNYANNINKFTDQQLELFQGAFVADVLVENDFRLVFGTKKNRKIKYTTAEGQKYNVSIQEFQQRWSGLIIDLNAIASINYFSRIKNDFLRRRSS